MVLVKEQLSILAVSVAFPALAIMTVVLRLRARAVKLQPCEADDCWILIAIIVTTAGCIPNVMFASNPCMSPIFGGIGTCEKGSGPVDYLLKTLFVFQLFYIASVSSVKISILLFYRRTFQTRLFAYAVSATLIFVTLWTIAFFLATLLQAWPISANWDGSEAVWTINWTWMYLSLLATNILADITTLCLPLLVLRRLKISRGEKLGLLGVFMVGTLAVIAAIAQLAYFICFYVVGTNDSFPTPALMIWASIEPSLGIISACLPLCYSASKLRSQDAILDANALDYNTMDSSQTVYTSPEGLPMYAGKFPNQHEDAMG